MIVILLCAWIALAIHSPQTAAEAARQSCKVWAVSVMPALFPFLTLSLLLVSRISANNKRDGSAVPAIVLLGMLGGSPAGARLLSQYSVRGKMSARMTQISAAGITTASPMFILGTLNGWLGGSGAADGYRMLAAHIVAALVAGGICAMWTREWKPQAQPTTLNDSQIQQPTLGFGDAVSQAAIAMLNVCGCMVLFNVLIACVIELIPMHATATTALACVLEMTGGCARAAVLDLPRGTTAAIMCAAATFGGISVFMQNASFLSKTPVRLDIQLAARAVAGVIAYCLCRAIFGEWHYTFVAMAAVLVACIFRVSKRSGYISTKVASSIAIGKPGPTPDIRVVTKPTVGAPFMASE